MTAYSIKDLEHITGIKAHTLRIWEQRYDFIHPHRTSTNIRYYTDDDLKLILNVNFLKNHGYKISDINKMAHETVRKTVNTLIENGYGYAEQLHALTLATIELNEEKFENILIAYTEEFSIEHMMTQLIFPFLNKMNVQWHTGSFSAIHKQFAATLIRQKLISAIDAEKFIPGPGTESYILFGPPEEKSEICLLFSQLILKKNKRRVINLSLNVKPEDLKILSKNFRPDYIFTTLFSPASQLKIFQYLAAISDIFPSSHLLIATKPYNKEILKNLPDNVKLIPSGSEFISFVTKSNN